MEQAVPERGGSPDLIGADLLHIVEHQISVHPRSLQRAIGPSELGTPCERKLLYKLAGPASVSASSSPGRGWLPTIGTAVHTWLEAALTDFNIRAGQVRFLLENRVTVGWVGAEEISGSVDVYDIINAAVVDWKVVGANTLRQARSKGASLTYRRQVMLYGRGFVNAGRPVDWVAVYYLPRNGSLSDAVWVPMRYDPAEAEAVIDRANGLATLAAVMPLADALAMVRPEDDYCSSCPFFKAGWSGPLDRGCPGVRPTDVDMLLGA